MADTIKRTFGFDIQGIPSTDKKPKIYVSEPVEIRSLQADSAPIPGEYTIEYTRYGIESTGKTLANYYPSLPPDKVFVLESVRTDGGTTNTFIDGSANNFTLTVTGNVTQGSHNPYEQELAALFDGNGDYVVVAESTDLILGNSDFTVEGWVKPTNNSFYLLKSNEDLGFNLGYNLDNTTQGLVLGTKDTSVTPTTPTTPTLIEIDLDTETEKTVLWGNRLRFYALSTDPVVPATYTITGINSGNIDVDLTGNMLFSTPSTIPIFSTFYQNIIDTWANQTYFIDAENGSDANNGLTSSTAWKTFNYAQSQTESITTPVMLIFYPGSYNVTSVLASDTTVECIFDDKGYERVFVCAPGQVTFNWLANSGRRDAPINQLKNTNSKVYGAIIKRDNNGRTTNYTVAFFRGFGSKGAYYNCVFSEVNSNNAWSLHYDNDNNMPLTIDNCTFYTGANAAGPYSGGNGLTILDCVFTHDDGSSISTTNTLFNLAVNPVTYVAASATTQGVWYGEATWTIETVSGIPNSIVEKEIILTPTLNTTLEDFDFSVTLNDSTTKTVSVIVKNGNEPTGSIDTLPNSNTNNNRLLLTTFETSASDNNTFLDSSSNNFTITRTGDANQTFFSPYRQKSYSWYFDGAGDSIETSSNVAIGTNPFTLECWIYPISAAANEAFICHAAGAASTNFQFNFRNTTGIIEFYHNNLSNFGSVNPVNFNSWNHVAVTGDGAGNIRLFLNGNLEATQSYSYNYSSTAGWRVGRNRGGTAYFEGYMYNVRVLNGTALYTDSFTPPTEPLTAITDTTFLVCHLPYAKDGSSNNHTLTLNGDVKSIPFAPVLSDDYLLTPADIGGSGYFDGTGDYLSIGQNSAFNFTGDFTFECWFNPSVLSGNRALFGNYTAATSADWYLRIAGAVLNVYLDGGSLRLSVTLPSANIWYHVAIVRSASTITGYLNGSSFGTWTSSNTIGSSSKTIYIGSQGEGSEPFNGYISSLRFVNGTAIYTTNFTPPIEPLTSNNETALLLKFDNLAIYDHSMASPNIRFYGNTLPSTTQKKYLEKSIYFDGTGDYAAIPTPSTEIRNWWDKPFTIEAWIYVNTHKQDSAAHPVLIKHGPHNSTTDYWSFGTVANGTLLFYYYNGGAVFSAVTTQTIPTQTWTHIAMSQSSGTINLSINGSVVKTVAVSGTPQSNNSNDITIGGNNSTYFDGYVEDLRITSGVARYTSNFSIPTRTLVPQLVIPEDLAGPSIANYGDTLTYYFYYGPNIIPDGTDLNYTITGITSENIVGSSLTGTIKVYDDASSLIFELEPYGIDTTLTVTITLPDNTTVSKSTVVRNQDIDPSLLTSAGVGSGGNVTSYTSGGSLYTVHTFTESGTFTPTTSGTINYLIVGGGSSGSYNNTYGVAGSGGGVLEGTVSVTANIGYTITVGLGGAALGTGSYTTGNDGQPSSAFSLTAGGGDTTGLNNSVSGAPQSNASNGAGGGAGGPATALNSPGPGYASSITGVEVRYAGGGGGGDTGNLGVDGGGNAANTGSRGTDGIPNRGGGGGSGAASRSQGSGAGGSGVVIVSYVTAAGDPNGKIEGSDKIIIGSSHQTYYYVNTDLADNSTVTYSISNLTESEVIGIPLTGTLVMVNGNTAFSFAIAESTSPKSIVITITLPNTDIVTKTIYLNPSLKIVTEDFFTNNSWNHFAVTRNSNNFKLWINGEQAGTTVTQTYNFGDTATGFTIGGDPDNSIFFQGRMSDVRITVGTSLYNTAFDLPIEQFTALTGTKLLTLARSKEDSNTFVDLSSAQNSLTAFGNVYNVYDSPTRLAPYQPNIGYGSAYFDGNGDFLRNDTVLDTFSATSDPFTFEYWVFLPSIPSEFKSVIGINDGTYQNTFLLGFEGSTGKIQLVYRTGSDQNIYLGTALLRQWQHIAAVYDGTTLKIYQNGVEIDSRSFTPNTALSNCSFQIGTEFDSGAALGNYFDGWLADFRIVKDTVYTAAFTPPSEPLTAITNTVLLLNFDNASVWDSTDSGNVGLHGGAVIDTVNVDTKLFSIDCTGTKWMTLSNINHRVNMTTTENYTLEFSFRNVTITNNTVIAGYGYGTYGPWLFYISGTNLVFYSSANGTSWNIADAVIIIQSMQINIWYKIKLVRDSAGYNIYVNDKLVLVDPATGNFFTPTRNYITFGADTEGTKHSSIYVEGIVISNTTDPATITTIGDNLTGTYEHTYTFTSTPITSNGNPTAVTVWGAREFPFISYQTASSLQYVVASDGTIAILTDTVENNDPTLDRNPRPAGTEVQGTGPRRIWF